MSGVNVEKILRWTIFGGVFLLPFIPLVVAQSLFFPFITGKNFAFRIIVEVMAAAWLALALVNPTYRPKRSWMLAAIAVFVFVIGLADIFGENAMKAIWSNFERMEGWVTLAHLLVYFTVAFSTMKTEKMWARLAGTSIGVSVLMGLYGLIQLAGFITINQGGDRLDATFGNATYLAVYMLFHVFVTALMWSRSWAHGERKLWLGSLYGAIIALQSVILLMTATRGAILGAIGGVTISALLLVILARQSKVAWRVSTSIVGVVVVLVLGFFLIKDTSFAGSFTPLERIASISTEQTTVKSRFMNWGMALEGVKERPILGWGQEGYNFVFNKYYNPGMYAQEPWFDRVHNIVFDWLVAGGILGFLSYTSIWFVALWFLWRGSTFTIQERSIFTGLLAAYGFHNLFVFDNIVSYILFFSVLAYVAFRVANDKGAAALIDKKLIPTKALPIVAGVMVIALWGTAWGVNAKALAANRALLKAVSPQEEGIGKNLELFEEAIAYGTYGTQEAREHLSQGASRIIQNPEIPIEAKQAFYEAANRELELQADSVPNDARFPLFLGVLAGAFGQSQDARGYLERARELSPTKQSILFQVGVNAFTLGEKEKAFETFKEAYELEPEYGEAHVLYVVAAIRADKDDIAAQLLEGLQDSELIVDQRILQAYVERGRSDIVAALWEQYLQNNPDNIQAYFSLSATYYSQGRITDSIQVLERAAEVNPAVEEQARALIEQIRSGSATLE